PWRPGRRPGGRRRGRRAVRGTVAPTGARVRRRPGREDPAAGDRGRRHHDRGRRGRHVRGGGPAGAGVHRAGVRRSRPGDRHQQAAPQPGVVRGTSKEHAMTGYGSRLAAVVAERGRLCVGLDPHPAILQQWGLPVDPTGVERLARTLVEAVADQVAVVKPQSAFFEAFGSAGIAVLERVLSDIRTAGAVSLLDVKRGDIGSTMAAYAEAYLADGSPLAADAITVSPYLGFGALTPAVELARSTGRGLYVLVRTSNPEG